MTKVSFKKGDQVATRDAYGKTLAALGDVDNKIVVMDADLSGSTKTGIFAKAFPERFFNVGVAEQDLMGTAAGLAEAGLTVFTSTFTMFATGRAWEIVRQSVAYPQMNVKVCSTHAGITVGEDGASHQAIEDIACMRVIPGMKVAVPADANQAASMTEVFAKEKGPAYMRLGRAKVETLFDEDYEFEWGEGHVLKEGSDVCLFTTGYVTKATLDAAEILEKEGVSVAVVNLPSIKPMANDLVTEYADKVKHCFSVEEHSVIGGLGSAVAEVMSERTTATLHRLGMQDEFGQSGPADELLAHYRLDAAGIAESVRMTLSAAA